jgi:hypothetical protein
VSWWSTPGELVKYRAAGIATPDPPFGGRLSTPTQSGGEETAAQRPGERRLGTLLENTYAVIYGAGGSMLRTASE